MKWLRTDSQLPPADEDVLCCWAKPEFDGSVAVLFLADDRPEPGSEDDPTWYEKDAGHDSASPLVSPEPTHWAIIELPKENLKV